MNMRKRSDSDVQAFASIINTLDMPILQKKVRYTEQEILVIS